MASVENNFFGENLLRLTMSDNSFPDIIKMLKQLPQKDNCDKNIVPSIIFNHVVIHLMSVLEKRLCG